MGDSEQEAASAQGQHQRTQRAQPDTAVIPPQQQAEERRQTEHGQQLPGKAGRLCERDACEPGDGKVNEEHCDYPSSKVVLRVGVASV